MSFKFAIVKKSYFKKDPGLTPNELIYTGGRFLSSGKNLYGYGSESCPVNMLYREDNKDCPYYLCGFMMIESEKNAKILGDLGVEGKAYVCSMYKLDEELQQEIERATRLFLLGSPRFYDIIDSPGYFEEKYNDFFFKFGKMTPQEIERKITYFVIFPEMFVILMFIKNEEGHMELFSACDLLLLSCEKKKIFTFDDNCSMNKEIIITEPFEAGFSRDHLYKPPVKKATVIKLLLYKSNRISIQEKNFEECI